MTQVTTGAAAIKGKLHAFNQVRFFNWFWDFSFFVMDGCLLLILPHRRILAIKSLLI